MTDNGSYSDVVFDLSRLLGYRFSPRLADLVGENTTKDFKERAKQIGYL